MKVKVKQTGAIIRVTYHAGKDAYLDTQNSTEYKESELTVLTK